MQDAPLLEPPDDLSDGVISLRRISPDDAPAWAQAFRDDPALGPKVGAETDPTEEEVAEQASSEAPPGQLPSLAITDAASGEFLGSVGLYRIDTRHRRGEVGFWLKPSARGRGVAGRATKLLTSWGFEQLGFERVELTTTPDNDETRRLALKLGFTEEGTMRERNRERGRRVDVVMFAVLRRDWRG
jgi:RimJ/RimL family protein N-acetyltransferase